MSENDHTKVRVILDLDSIATKVTEMGATPFWSDLFRLIATEKGFGNGPQKVVFANYPDSVVVGMGEFADDDYEPEVKRFKALDREMTYTTFGEGIVFEIPTNHEQTNMQEGRSTVAEDGIQTNDLPEPIRCSTWSQWTDTIKKETEMNYVTDKYIQDSFAHQVNGLGIHPQAAQLILEKAKDALLKNRDYKFERTVYGDRIKIGSGSGFAVGFVEQRVFDGTSVCYSANEDDAVFLITKIQPEKETSVIEENKEQGEATKHGPAMTVEEITNILLDLGVSQIDVKESFAGLPTKLAIGKLPNVTIHRVGNKITLTYGNTEKAILLDKSSVLDENLPTSMRLSPEEIRYEVFDDIVNQSGLYIYTVSPKEETEMLYPPKTTIQILKPIYRDRLEKAGLSDEAIQLISDEIFHGSALKAPKEDSSFVVVAGKDVLNVYYSHDNNSVVLTNAEANQVTRIGEIISYSTGINDAFFAIDTSNTRDKLIQRHLGVPKLTLNLSNGNSIELPFKKEYVGVAENTVTIRLDCDVVMCLSNKDLNSITGPALTDLNETQKDRYFVNGTEYTLEEFNRKVALWKKQGIINPEQGSWKDIGA